MTYMTQPEYILDLRNSLNEVLVEYGLPKFRKSIKIVDITKPILMID